VSHVAHNGEISWSNLSGNCCCHLANRNDAISHIAKWPCYLFDFLILSETLRCNDACTAVGDDVDTANTDVTRTGASYRRLIAASAISNNTGLRCSMQFDRAVQPTATLPELEDSPIPPNYTFTWNSPPVAIVGQYMRQKPSCR